LVRIFGFFLFSKRERLLPPPFLLHNGESSLLSGGTTIVSLSPFPSESCPGVSFPFSTKGGTSFFFFTFPPFYCSGKFPPSFFPHPPVSPFPLLKCIFPERSPRVPPPFFPRTLSQLLFGRGSSRGEEEGVRGAFFPSLFGRLLIQKGAPLFFFPLKPHPPFVSQKEIFFSSPFFILGSIFFPSSPPL